MKDVISEANRWAMGVWTRVVPNWEDRSQDHNYRDILARPGIYSTLESLSPISNGRFLDIGCGEGAETFFIRDSLAKLGWTGTMFGYDPQDHFIQVASERSRPHAKIPAQFGSGSVASFVESNRLEHKIDLLTSVFVLQDLPNIEQYFSTVNNVLSAAGTAIFVLVHPDFGEKMKSKGVVNLEPALNSTQDSAPWRWAGEYPIVEENNKTFFVPYFQRTIDDYRDYLSPYFSEVEFVALKPTAAVSTIAKAEHRSPFFDHLGNVYYPEIVESESSLIIVAKR